MVQYMSTLSTIADKSFELARTKICETYEMLDPVIQSELPLSKDPNDDESFLEGLILDSMEWQSKQKCVLRHVKN